MSNLDLNPSVDDRNRMALQRNFAGHAGSPVVTLKVPKWKEHSTILPLMMLSSDRDAAP
jgi:hypothetical protein